MTAREHSATSGREKAIAIERSVRRHLSRGRRFAVALATPIFLVVVALYQGANVLRENAQPSAEFWSLGAGIQMQGALAMLGLVSVAYIALDSWFRVRQSRGARNDRSVEELVMALLVNIHEGSSRKIPITSLVGHVHRATWGLTGMWFERVSVFKLDPRIPPSGVPWQATKGALGLASRENAPFTVDLADLHEAYDRDPEAFGRLDAAKRLGLTPEEFKASRHYWSIYVAPVIGERGNFVGVATVSCTAKGTYEDLKRAAASAKVDEPVPAIERALRRR